MRQTLRETAAATSPGATRTVAAGRKPACTPSPQQSVRLARSARSLMVSLFLHTRAHPTLQPSLLLFLKRGVCARSQRVHPVRRLQRGRLRSRQGRRELLRRHRLSDGHDHLLRKADLSNLLERVLRPGLRGRNQPRRALCHVGDNPRRPCVLMLVFCVENRKGDAPPLNRSH